MHLSISFSLYVYFCVCVHIYLAHRRIRPRGRRRVGRWSVAVCGPALYYYHEDFSVRMVEWLEILRAQGFARVFLSVTDIHPNLERVLRYYEAQGFVGMVRFSYPEPYVNEPSIRRWELVASTCMITNTCTYVHTHTHKHNAHIHADLSVFISICVSLLLPICAYPIITVFSIKIRVGNRRAKPCPLSTGNIDICLFSIFHNWLFCHLLKYILRKLLPWYITLFDRYT